MGIIIVLLYSLLRVIGGRDEETLRKFHIPFTPRIWKRLIAPSFLSLSICILSALAHHFHWFYILSIGAFILSAYSDGYGNDSGVTWKEVLQRILSAFASTLPAIIFCLGSKSWLLLCIQLALAIAVKVTMNFVKVKAPLEEGIINFCDSVVKPFMV